MTLVFSGFCLILDLAHNTTKFKMPFVKVLLESLHFCELLMQYHQRTLNLNFVCGKVLVDC